MKKCKFKGCKRGPRSKGYCARCYVRLIGLPRNRLRRCSETGCKRRRYSLFRFCTHHCPSHPLNKRRVCMEVFLRGVVVSMRFASRGGLFRKRRTYGSGFRQIGQHVPSTDIFLRRYRKDRFVLNLYDQWRRSGFVKRLTPTCFRIDPYGSYGFKNLRWATKADALSLLNALRITGKHKEGNI